jgi:hypothetical protein
MWRLRRDVRTPRCGVFTVCDFFSVGFRKVPGGAVVLVDAPEMCQHYSFVFCRFFRQFFKARFS